jgi:hypothetical protein
VNAIERRNLIRSNIIDKKIVRAALHQSRRHQGESANRLRKERAAETFARQTLESSAYLFQDAS